VERQVALVEQQVPAEHDLSLLLRQNFYFPNENQNCIAVDNGRLVLQSVEFGRPEAALAIKRNQSVPSICDHEFVEFNDILSLNC
jgi:hypothetical protein